MQYVARDRRDKYHKGTMSRSTADSQETESAVPLGEAGFVIQYLIMMIVGKVRSGF